MARLSVNLDHVATLRQLRGTQYPDILQAAELVRQGGADGITLVLVGVVRLAAQCKAWVTQ